jgi:hypothetical protein
VAAAREGGRLVIEKSGARVKETKFNAKVRRGWW